MIARLTGLARAAAPFVLLWVAVHAVLLALIAAVWGLAVVIKALLAFVVHAAFWIILAMTGIWLALRVTRAAEDKSAHIGA